MPLSTYESLLEKYNALVGQVVAFKRDGWVPPESYGEAAQAVELPKAIEAAIVALGVDNQTARHLRSEAWQMLRANIEEPEIVKRITEGEQVEL